MKLMHIPKKYPKRFPIAVSLGTWYPIDFRKISILNIQMKRLLVPDQTCRGGGCSALGVAVSGHLKCGFKRGLRFRYLWIAVLCAGCGLITFAGRGFPQISTRFAVLDEKSSFWANFWKSLLTRVDEITYQNARSMARKANLHQTAPTAPPHVGQ